MLGVSRRTSPDNAPLSIKRCTAGRERGRRQARIPRDMRKQAQSGACSFHQLFRHAVSRSFFRIMGLLYRILSRMRNMQRHGIMQTHVQSLRTDRGSVSFSGLILDQLFIFGLKRIAARYPNSTAAEIPPAAAVTPPVNAPRMPVSFTPSIAPCAKA